MVNIKKIVRLFGKSERKVGAVFATSRDSCDRCIRHLRVGVPELPIWVFSMEAPSPELAGLCERVIVGNNSLALFLTAQNQLWRYWVALAVATWTGEHGRWPLKSIPFLIPPFHVLLLNEDGGFFAANLRSLSLHCKARYSGFAISAWRRVKDWHRGIWLLLLSWTARPFGFATRYVYRRLPKTARLEMTATPSNDCGILRIEYENRDWDWRSVLRQLQTSNSRCVLFKEKRSGEAVEDMLPLFEDPFTFAVSRQPGFRGWRKMNFAMAPFRALQPREASLVQSPLSGTMLVDRRKLLALGLPRTVAFGSAWFVLFWKAAAAGWPSFSVGDTEPVGEMMDFSLEEAEFIKTILLDAELKCLGPAQPALRRGNVSFQIDAAGGYRGLPRVLVVSPYLPFPLAHGGAVRIYNLCAAVSDRFDFLLVCFRESNERVFYEELHHVFREVYVVDADEKHADDSLPRQVNEYQSTAMAALIKDLCHRRQVDLLQIEYTQMAAYRDCAPDLPAILVEHDLTFALHRQLAACDQSKESYVEYERWLRFESESLGAFDAVWTMSEADKAAAMEHGSNPRHTYVVPNGVALSQFRVVTQDAVGPEVLYVGSFRHLPNLLGFEQLRHVIMPAVWNRMPDVRLRVVAGPDHDEHWTRFRGRDATRGIDSRIDIHGFVEDLAPLYASASVVAVPLVASAGTSIKLIEALACGRAVVTTQTGCHGLDLADGVDVVIRESGPEFAEAIIRVLEDPAFRARLEHQGRRTAEERFGWISIAEKACSSYQALIQRPDEATVAPVWSEEEQTFYMHDFPNLVFSGLRMAEQSGSPEIVARVAAILRDAHRCGRIGINARNIHTNSPSRRDT